ncbi:hypothetical protein B0H67DRAFT_264416 [Lasiosphaeris hirsuta]|uniref:Uncharacterized protein n=1 Tax=Lasiosphaeris hirsuta TaxID=260670 RepID=A0AA40A7N0_9PEZI|nr:hypothetical protein B0H67DRAFT_264416 [Lasiosphaeris hirsuta]
MLRPFIAPLGTPSPGHCKTLAPAGLLLRLFGLQGRCVAFYNPTLVCSAGLLRCCDCEEGLRLIARKERPIKIINIPFGIPEISFLMLERPCRGFYSQLGERFLTNKQSKAGL